MITVADLRMTECEGLSLACAECGSECSANPSDYFLLPEDYVFVCDNPTHSRTDLALVRKRVVFDIVKT
jgi:hypothetical protein